MTQLMTQLVYVIVTSLAAAGADIGHVMVLEDELPSTIPASRPTVPGKSSSSHSLAHFLEFRAVRNGENTCCDGTFF